MGIYLILSATRSNNLARIRSVKPEFWTDGDMLKLSRDTRLFYIGLWNFADDNGVIENHPLSLKARIFPCDDVDVAKCIQELISVNKLFPYKNGDSKDWMIIVSFAKHQNPDRPRKTNNPLPSEEQLKSAGISRNHMKSTEISLGEDRIGEDRIGEDRTLIAQCEKVVRYLNIKSGSKFEHTNKQWVRLISARIKDGCTLEDFEKVIDWKVEQWGKDPKMSSYLRPSTLFTANHMEEYLNESRRRLCRKA